ncbi:MAG: hypothetical protein GY856_34105 [bacterium]|nr:hypothetical protein [bacterium]
MSATELVAGVPAASGPTTATRIPPRGKWESLFSGAAPSETILAEIRSLISAGDVLAARELAAEAAGRFPEDAELRNAQRILCDGKSYVIPGKRGPSRREEFKWLRNPPACYRGKWVALVGREVVASAETLKEVLASLPSDLEHLPLAVQIAE